MKHAFDRPDEQRALEAICDRGCRYANRCIEALAEGRPVPEAEALSPTQKTALLDELRSIMAVYQHCR